MTSQYRTVDTDLFKDVRESEPSYAALPQGSFLHNYGTLIIRTKAFTVRPLPEHVHMHVHGLCALG